MPTAIDIGFQTGPAGPQAATPAVATADTSPLRWALVLALSCLAGLVVSCAGKEKSEARHAGSTLAAQSTTASNLPVQSKEWEDRVPVGMPEADFQGVIREDAWASRWMSLKPKTMTSMEILDWARTRPSFVGGLHTNKGFLSAVSGKGPFHLYSAQGIPSTARQMTVVCAADHDREWRVVFRAVRPRPCF